MCTNCESSKIHEMHDLLACSVSAEINCGASLGGQPPKPYSPILFWLIRIGLMYKKFDVWMKYTSYTLRPYMKGRQNNISPTHEIYLEPALSLSLSLSLSHTLSLSPHSFSIQQILKIKLLCTLICSLLLTAMTGFL